MELQWKVSRTREGRVLINSKHVKTLNASDSDRELLSRIADRDEIVLNCSRLC